LRVEVPITEEQARFPCPVSDLNEVGRLLSPFLDDLQGCHRLLQVEKFTIVQRFRQQLPKPLILGGRNPGQEGAALGNRNFWTLRAVIVGMLRGPSAEVNGYHEPTPHDEPSV